MANATDHMRGRARGLRRSLTVSEQRLWNTLRKRTFGGYKFRRQVPIGRYVVDFYCAELSLVLELDGQQHDALWMLDHENERTRDLRSRGLEVVRITNGLMASDSLFVEQTIDQAIRRRIEDLGLTPREQLMNRDT